MIEDTQAVSQKNARQCNGLKYSQWSTKHYTENPRSSNTTPLLKKKKQSKKELMNSFPPDGFAFPAALVAPVVLPTLQTR